MRPGPHALPSDRKLLTWREMRELLRFRRPEWRPRERRLQAALTIDDLRRAAKRTTPRSVYEYVDGAADREITWRRNRAAFDAISFIPDGLTQVGSVDSSTTLLGRTIGMPFVFAPTGYSRMMHHAGEAAVARVAQSRDLPYTLSTVGTSTIEEVMAAAPEGDNWFQLYLTREESLNHDLIVRARNAGVTTLVLTIDTQVGGRRLRDVRNGLTIPPTLTLRTFLGMCRHPSWSINKLTTPPIELACVRGFDGTSADVAARLFNPDIDTAAVQRLRDQWPHVLLVKGIASPTVAAKVIALGADGVVVSNHGGRQMDRLPATLAILPEIRAAVGDNPTVLVDGGVMHGADIVAARALGADAVMAGRAYLYGLMAGGEPGVQKALSILTEEYRRTLQLLGIRATAGIGRRHVRAGSFAQPPESADVFTESWEGL